MSQEKMAFWSAASVTASADNTNEAINPRMLETSISPKAHRCVEPVGSASGSVPGVALSSVSRSESTEYTVPLQAGSHLRQVPRDFEPARPLARSGHGYRCAQVAVWLARNRFNTIGRLGASVRVRWYFRGGCRTPRTESVSTNAWRASLMVRGPAQLRQVASRAGVSMATASAALRGVGRISPATVARVKAVAREQGY
ncbi:MAG: LacI family DNA-binding transcriptional regulator, partial [Actinomycetes bacterium]